MNNFYKPLALLFLALFATAVSAQKASTAILFDVLTADGEQVLTAAEPGKPVTLSGKDGRNYQLVGQKEGKTIKVVLQRKGTDSNSSTEYLGEVRSFSGERITLNAPGLSPLLDIAVEEMPIEQVRKKLKDSGAQCLSTSERQPSLALDSDTSSPNKQPARCCVRC